MLFGWLSISKLALGELSVYTYLSKIPVSKHMVDLTCFFSVIDRLFLKLPKKIKSILSNDRSVSAKINSGGLMLGLVKRGHSFIFSPFHDASWKMLL